MDRAVIPTATRTALIIAANGASGGAVADELASRGVALYLVGRHPQALEERAQRLRSMVAVHTQVLDALDEPALDRYRASLGARGVCIDFLLNAIGPFPTLVWIDLNEITVHRAQCPLDHDDWAVPPRRPETSKEGIA